MTPASVQANARAEVRETWLGMRHQGRIAWRSSRLFAVLALVGASVFTVLAGIVASVQTASMVEVPLVGPELIGVVWFSLLLLPAIGGGGDDDATALAAVPAGRSFRSGMHLVSTSTDLASGVLIPALGTLGAFIAGWPGWAAGLALGLLGLLAGQVSGAAAAKLTNRLGPTATLTIVSAVAAVTIRYASDIGPASWFVALSSEPASYLVALVAAFGLLLAARALTDTHPYAVRRAHRGRVPSDVRLALYSTGLSGVTRALVARNSMLTVILMPLIAKAVGLPVGSGLPLILTVSAAVMVGANGFSYDAGGASWLISRVRIRTVLAVRYLVALTWIGIVSLVATAVTMSIGGAVTGQTAAQLLVIAVGGAAAGLVPSIKRPTSVDLDLPRAQPAPPASAVGVLARVMLIAMCVTTLPVLVGAVIAVVYCGAAFYHAARIGRDPVSLAALT